MSMHADAPAALIDYYRALESRAHVMLQSAREDRWDEVQRARDDCKPLIAALQRAQRERVLSPAEDLERMKILKAIVLCDGETRRLSSSQVRSFDRLLSAQRGDC